MGWIRRTIETRTLAPRLTDRVVSAWHAGGWARTALLRRVAAGGLIVLAAVLAVSSQAGAGDQQRIVVAARDLAPGVELDASMLVMSARARETVPDGAVTSLDEVTGRLLAGPLRRGEALTDVRLAGPQLARAVSANADAVNVPLQLSNPDIAALLHPGATVDVVTLGPDLDQPVVLARGATVVTVLDPKSANGSRDEQLVLVALDPDAATRVAAASLSRPVTVTVS